MDRRDLEMILRNMKRKSRLKPILLLIIMFVGGYLLIKNIWKIKAFSGEITGSFIKIPSNYPIDIKLYGKVVDVVPVGIKGILTLKNAKITVGNIFLSSSFVEIVDFNGNFSNFTFNKINYEDLSISSPSSSKIISKEGYTIRGQVDNIVVRGFDGSIEIFGGKKKIKGYLILEKFEGTLSFEGGNLNLNGTVTGIKII